MLRGKKIGIDAMITLCHCSAVINNGQMRDGWWGIRNGGIISVGELMLVTNDVARIFIVC